MGGIIQGNFSPGRAVENKRTILSVAPAGACDFVRLETHGYTATRHQREVGAGYFDDIVTTLTAGNASTLALTGSTEQQQFED